MINYTSKALRSVTPEEWFVIAPTIGLWALSISSAYYHCVMQGLEFMEPPAMHIVGGTLAMVCTGAMFLHVRYNR